jgi:acyl dehydratase
MKAGDRLGPYNHEMTREQLVRYAGASGDFNPIHYDDERAREFGLPGVIAHGMLNMGLIARYLSAALPAGARFEEYGVRFRAYVRPGERLSLTARVDEVVKEARRSLATLSIELMTGSGVSAVTGRARVSWATDVEETWPAT